MSKSGVKQLTVPASMYAEVKRLVDQASVTQDILHLFDEYALDAPTREALLKSVLADIVKYRDAPALLLKGRIITLLCTHYGLSAVDAFNVLDALLTS
jgi:hypothetical protein